MFEMLLYKIKSYFTLAMCSVMPTIACATSEAPPKQLNLKLPSGFEVSIYAKLDVLPRMMAFGPDGQLYVTSAKGDQVLMVPDHNQDGVAEAPIVIPHTFDRPNGLTFVDNNLLVANQNGIVKLTQSKNGWSVPQPFISNLATGGHSVKTIKLGPDNHLYINVGSSCNVCNEDDPTRATILRYTKDGRPAGAIPVVGRHQLPPIWARGLRNSQGFAWQPNTQAMFATNNGADMRSETKNGKVNDELPPEHINHIERGKHYGWPHCWGDSTAGQMFTDPNFPGTDDFCSTATAPAIMLTSHSTPIGITFLDKSHFPSEFKQDAIVALHGSWNREQLSGYQLTRLHFRDGKPVKASDFTTGWLNNNRAWGRPVDVVVGPDGALYVTDDRTGYIYRIRYQ